ncbi:type II toxin-antitoxin system VapB family antitoxin [Moraxella nasicaprae]|uniref:Type II toxin-antitoxin system VapB family antitoxin n=1 Tax=Moraxella nasicaprae TaxID=2904122 RepID=A0ABY6F6P0_9GAMM|nr:type II toxin-antitoxin system VapB family antitoxin [Moraxella nasicaprae]UXZ05540.1 type II toxin-antitoxin system VapB family antitoxin [Moraxella nasicaprae]
MPITTVFMNNRTQAVRIPSGLKFNDDIKQVIIRKVGKELIISPQDGVWDSFFLSDERVSDDFDRPTPAMPSQRASFD